jgi:ADP-ribosylglycohydrolase
MIGAIAGDILGSQYEFNNISNENFGPLFSDKSTYTDDSVLTISTADVILNDGIFSEQYLKYAQIYPNRGYGSNFKEMVKRGRLEPYDSYGNGSAMRVSPVGWAYDEDSIVAINAKKSAECTHNNPEGIKGSQAVARAILAARKGYDKEYIKKMVEEIGYDLSKKTHEFPRQFDVTCQGTIPRCMAILFETDDFEGAMRKAVAMGGDVDTNCCIVGGICDALYGLPSREVIEETYARLPKQMADVTTAFVKKYIQQDFQEPNNVGSKVSTFGDSLSGLFS